MNKQYQIPSSDVYKRQIINLSAQLPAGIVAIVMAYRGMGVYALALQTVLASLDVYKRQIQIQ